MIRTDGPMYEYGCHEGNHDIRHILEINRNLERHGGRGGGGRDLEVALRGCCSNPGPGRCGLPLAPAPAQASYSRIHRWVGEDQMKHSTLAASAALVAIALLAPVSAAAQVAGETDASAAWTMPRTQDGHPDMQGYWTTQTFTPVERPEHLGEKAFFTEEEVAELQRQLTAEGVDPLRRDAIAIADDAEREEALYQENRDPSYVHYDNQVWLRTPVPKGLSSRQDLADHGSAQRPDSAPDARGRRAHRP